MYLWATDTHLNLLSDTRIKDWAAEIKKDYPKAKGLILTGDIANGSTLERSLKTLRDALSFPIYFVLGNHDYWGYSFAEMDAKVKDFGEGLINLDNKLISLDSTTALVGSSGWYDAIYGEVNETSVEMTDWSSINDLIPEAGRLDRMKSRSAKLAFELLAQMSRAQKKGYNRIVVATHFPPFEALIKKDDDRKPFYGSAFMGSAILAGATTMDEVIVLCGHTHEGAQHVEDSKVFAYCAPVSRGRPQIAGILDTDEFELHFFL